LVGSCDIDRRSPPIWTSNFDSRQSQLSGVASPRNQRFVLSSELRLSENSYSIGIKR
jgi:hypothetical protein